MSRTPAPPLPPQKLRFMGDDDESFVAIGDRLVVDLRSLAYMGDFADVLDIGSGYGRVAHALLRDHAFRGTYVGVDILKRHVDWCHDHLANDRFRFHHIDVQNDRYNPTGTIAAHRGTLGVRRSSADVVVLSSVFTHMWPEEVRHYLRLVRRALRRGGSAYATFFLLNDSWRQLETEGKSTRFPLPHAHTSFCRFMDPDNPLHVIAYEQDWVIEELREARLAPEHVRLGAWSGRAGAIGLQDVVVFGRR